MDRHSGNNASQSQSTSQLSTINNPSLPLGSGQQASILQIGGQSFLILTLGQSSSPLQGLGLNVVTVGGPNASLLQTGGPQEQLLQVRCVQPAISQIGGIQPLSNQSGRVQPNIVQMSGPQPATIQLGPGVQLQTVQANKFKPSQAISPLDTRVQVGELRSSSVQGGHTVPPQLATSQIHAPKFTSVSLVEDRVQSVITQTGGATPLSNQTSRAQPSTVQIGGIKPLSNQSGRVQPNIVQMRSPQPATIQLGPGVQLQTVQANEFKPSHSISPLDTRVQVGELRPLSVQGGHTVPPQLATSQIHAPKFTSVSLVQSVITQNGGATPLLNQTSRAQPSTVQIGGHVTSSVQVGSTPPLGMVKTKTSKIRIQTTTEKTFHPALVQKSGTMPPSSQTGRFQGRIAQFGRLQSSSTQVTSAVPIQTEFSQSHATIKTEPGLEEPAEMLTIQASGHYAETTNAIHFGTPTVQPSLFQPSLGHAGGGLHTLAPQENANIFALTKKNKQSSTKKGSKCQQDTPKYADIAGSAYNLIKMKNTCANTTKMNKSIGTQAKISLKSKSQAIQFPENSFGEPEVPTYQECSTQSEESFWPGEVGFQQSRESYPYKVEIRDPEPESVGVFFSEASLRDSDEAWNMEGAEKWIHKSYQAEHPHFDDIAVYFTEEEWACLNDKERNLYTRVMMDNYWNLVAVGEISVTPPLISKIERGEEPCIRSLQQADHKQLSDHADDVSSQNIFGERYNIQRFYERLKMITTPMRLANAGLTVTSIMSDPSSCEPSQAAQGEPRTKNPGDQCPYKPFLKEKPVINERPFRCVKCEQTFKLFGNLSRHYQRVHRSENHLTCSESECGKKFSNMKALLLHLMRHTGERPFICTGCGRTFTSQVCLNNHYGLNSKNKKQYECLECGKKFNLKHCLVKHEQLHQMDNHNVCLVCGKKFAHQSGLRLHEKIHGGHYVCSQCGRYFSGKEDCEKHMLDHGQMQLCVCTECGNAFFDESQLIEHQKLHQADYNLVYPDLVIKVKEED